MDRMPWTAQSWHEVFAFLVKAFVIALLASVLYWLGPSLAAAVVSCGVATWLVGRRLRIPADPG